MFFCNFMRNEEKKTGVFVKVLKDSIVSNKTRVKSSEFSRSEMIISIEVLIDQKLDIAGKCIRAGKGSRKRMTCGITG